MSQPMAIAAATTTLRNLLLARMPAIDTELSDLEVTTQPPDLARKNISKAQLNLFLYQTVHNAAWSNFDMPGQVRAGERAAPPLAINLRYLITAYGRGDTDAEAIGHRVLGSAMSVLHDHPVLGRDELRLALPASAVAAQFERLRITPLSFSIEELSKLWTIFQTQYRVSAAYEVTVVLIDSRAPLKAGPPVLSIGITAIAGPAARLMEVRPPFAQAAARQGEDIVLLGTGMPADKVLVQFSSPRLKDPIFLAPLAGGTAGAIRVHLPDVTEKASALTAWAPGLYTCSLSLTSQDTARSMGNPVAFALAPRIAVAPASAAAGTVALTLTCTPRIVDGQYVRLIFGEHAYEPVSLSTPPDVSKPSTLKFKLPAIQAGSYLVRLRVDGVDSIPVLQQGDPPHPVFDVAQRVTVT